MAKKHTEDGGLLTVAELPGHDLAWSARLGFPPGQTGQLLALMHEFDLQLTE
ncbi:MAG TPA: DUF3820 family protein [Rhodocyclaceae bacterium]|nr:DUF3820 family protein [Rhodocyclaceae bacterium]